MEFSTCFLTLLFIQEQKLYNQMLIFVMMIKYKFIYKMYINDKEKKLNISIQSLKSNPTLKNFILYLILNLNKKKWNSETNYKLKWLWP